MNTTISINEIPERDIYAETGEPRGNGPRCATCGDLAAWGTHPLCASTEDGGLEVSR